MYAEDGSLLGEYDSGASASSGIGATQYLYLPTASGPMPVAAVIDGIVYAVHSDHLNTPRRLTRADGQVAGILLPEIMPQEFLMDILKYMLPELPGRRLTTTFPFSTKHENNIQHAWKNYFR